MPIYIENNDKPRELHPPGMTQAVCIGVEDIGLQKSSFQGADKIQRKVVFLWETTKKDASGHPFIMSKKYTASMFDKANLRKDLEGWAGKKFTDEQAKKVDVELFKGRNCLLNIVHSDDEKYANIAGITPVMEGMPPIKPTGNVPDGLKKWLDKMRSEAVEPMDSHEEPPPHDADDMPEFLRN